MGHCEVLAGKGAVPALAQGWAAAEERARAAPEEGDTVADGDIMQQ